MRTIEIKQMLYEPGDLLNIEAVNINELSNVRDSQKKNVLKDSRIIMVMKTYISKNGFVSYKIMAQNGLCTRLRSTELESAKFIKNMKDFAEFFGPVEKE